MGPSPQCRLRLTHKKEEVGKGGKSSLRSRRKKTASLAYSTPNSGSPEFSLPNSGKDGKAGPVQPQNCRVLNDTGPGLGVGGTGHSHSQPGFSCLHHPCQKTTVGTQPREGRGLSPGHTALWEEGGRIPMGNSGLRARHLLGCWATPQALHM